MNEIAKQLQISNALTIRANAYLKQLPEFAPHFTEPLQNLLASSDYVCRQLEELKQLLMEDDCLNALYFENYQQLLLPLTHQNQNLFMAGLRRFRHRHFLRLLLREAANLANSEQTMASWSDCADAIILKCLDFCQLELSKRYGNPVNESGEDCTLQVLAMGKLGGRELNYSSDIDLIFYYSESGFTNGVKTLSNQQFYSKLVQMFVQILQTPTENGLVFRVDLRLRPNGESGALVSTIAAMETYYQEQGRDWERYAMVKARLIGEEDSHQNSWFHRLLRPFVYRRYVDFSVIDSLRSMKAMIMREVQLNPMLDDIKRGLGGIREIEFIIQNIQLVRGGRLVQLRQQNALLALEVIKEQAMLPRTAALKQAYLFLRRLENSLQALNDQQTHSLPKEEFKQAQIVMAMGFSSWDLLLSKLKQYQRIVNLIFRSILGKVDFWEDNQLIIHQLTSLWQGHVETNMAVNLLESLGLHAPKHCYQMLHSFRHSPRLRRLTQAARLRLDRFMVLLLHKLIQIPQTDSVLLQMIHLLENIVGRSAYLALLTENPRVLDELLHWFAQSPFIQSLIVSQPFLLEMLIDPEKKWRLFSRSELKKHLEDQLLDCQETELEDNLLRQFKLYNWFFAARAEMRGHYNSIRIGRFLADVAEVIIEKVVELACQRLAPRYPQIREIKKRFAIIAYGKLGSREMNYNSDLDLVFIHDARPDEEPLVTRLSQKILHLLTIRLQSGLLYTVDTRLRPSGSAGLLVSTVDAFNDYQREQAWTWEHQALLRARVLSENKRIVIVFKQLKTDLLFRVRDKQKLREEILSMRMKISQHNLDDSVKYAVGGLVDLEFLIQYLVLSHPKSIFLRYTHSLSLLQKLYTEAVISKEDMNKLKQAYQHYHFLLHQNLLKPGSLAFGNEQFDVISISNRLFYS